MEKRSSEQTTCPSCGTPCSRQRVYVSNPSFLVGLVGCARCTGLLAQAFAGVARAWSEQHGTAKERFFVELIDRLKKHGFDPVEPFRPRIRRV